MAKESLSSAMEDYLEIILELSEKEVPVRITDIAEKLDITKTSATQAISSLKKRKLVNQERYGPVSLTDKGRERAVKVRHRHRVIRSFLCNVLGISPKVAEKDACRMEHVVSQQTLDSFVQFLDNLNFDTES